ncbi:hypothetical protein AAEX28_01795 [Lentisphaerota bacterium WC36G]|nr:hypothetical protein LJT99_04680 [Lentisphaerae bacterium WC36]
MSNYDSTQLLWDFPAGIWGICGVIFLGILIFGISYYFTLRKLPKSIKISLTIIRLIFLSLLIFCLCNVRVEKKKAVETVTNKKIAVLFDNSFSMHKIGFWKKNRLDNALSFWQNNVIKPKNKNLKIDFYSFADKLNFEGDFSQIKNLKKTSKDAKKQTNFYQTVSKINSGNFNNKYDGVLVFTDGIDTGNNIQQNLKNAKMSLINSNLRNVFIPITTDVPMEPKVTLKRIENMSKGPLNTTIKVNVITQLSNISLNKKLCLKIYDERKKLIEEINIKRQRVSGIISSRFNCNIKEIGLKKYTVELCFNNKVVDSSIFSITGFIPREKRKVLLYQGALDWGTRFLKYNFTDEKYQLDVLFAPSVMQPSFNGKDTNFPKFEKLMTYDAILLLNLNSKQIDKQMEKRLKKFVNQGGGILFITGNPMIAKEFANSEIEKLLPVIFSDKYNREKRLDSASQELLERSKNNRDISYTNFLRKKEYTLKVPELKEFSLTRTGKNSILFKDLAQKKLIIPKFQDYAFVSKIKPGAQALAYYTDSKKREHILMAVQNFGNGRSAVLTTDPLWRWRLATNSEDNSYEIFWKNLVGWLGASKDCNSEWIYPSSLLDNNKENVVYFQTKLSVKNNNKLQFYYLADERKELLHLEPCQKKNMYKTVIEANIKSKNIKLIAERITDDDKVITEAEAYLDFSKEHSDDLEVKMLHSSVENFKPLESIPNVKVVKAEQSLNLNELFSSEKNVIVKKELFPLWHKWLIFIALLILFTGELIARRFFKLV